MLADANPAIDADNLRFWFMCYFYGLGSKCFRLAAASGTSKGYLDVPMHQLKSVVSTSSANKWLL